jgi:uncharacterized protein (UPF0216 family)
MINDKYKDLDHDTFVSILEGIIEELSASSLIALPGIYEILSEQYNDEVLIRYEQMQAEMIGPILEKTKEMYEDDNLRVYDDAEIEEVDDGYWVSVSVWVSKRDIEEGDEEE